MFFRFRWYLWICSIMTTACAMVSYLFSCNFLCFLGNINIDILKIDRKSPKLDQNNTNIWSNHCLIHAWSNSLSHPFVLSLQICSLFHSLFIIRTLKPNTDTLIQTFFGLIVIWSMCYLIYALSDPCVIWSIRYLIHALSDHCFVWSMRYPIYM